jgi:hypothetical protein
VTSPPPPGWTVLLNHPLITPGQLSGWLGVLTCDALNRLHAEPSCCRSCCAPCATLDDMRQIGLLSNVVRQAPTRLWEDAPWLDGQDVDLGWLDGQWPCCSRAPR